LASVVTTALSVLFVVQARAADLRWSGLLDLVAAEHTDAYVLNTLTHGDNPWDAYRLRVFAESQVDDHLQVQGQFVYNDGSNVYVDGAYVIFTPWASHDLRLMGGKQPWMIGTYAPRTYSNKNPLIGTPLMYQYHTSLQWHGIPANADVLLGASGTGQSGVKYGGGPQGQGMPIVDENY
jgi:hypothetical protein